MTTPHHFRFGECMTAGCHAHEGGNLEVKSCPAGHPMVYAAADRAPVRVLLSAGVVVTATLVGWDSARHRATVRLLSGRHAKVHTASILEVIPNGS